MMATVEMTGKPLRVAWSEAAATALQDLASPLSVEMELYFGCLIRKKVRRGGKQVQFRSGGAALAGCVPAGHVEILPVGEERGWASAGGLPPWPTPRRSFRAG